MGQQCCELLGPCWQWCANGCKNSQQCWDLQYIVEKIQPIRLWSPRVMHVRGPVDATNCAINGTKEMLGVVGSNVWPILNFAQQFPTCNRVCKRTQQVTSTNLGSCWPTMMRLSALGLRFILVSSCMVKIVRNIETCAIYLVYSSTFWVCGWNPMVWPFK